MWLPGTYHNGFAPRDGVPRYPQLWHGCVGAWNPGLGPTGIVLRDSGPYKQHGTFTNPTPAVSWVVAGNQYATHWSGTTTTLSATLNQTYGVAQRKTFSIWLQVLSFGAGFTSNPIVTTGSGTYFRISLQNGVDRVHVGSNTASSYFASPTIGKWYHIASVWHGTANRLVNYVDGKVLSDVSPAYNVSVDSLNFLSASTDSPSYRIGAVALYDRVMSPQEIHLLSRRQSIAYELAPRRRAGETTAAFQSSWAYRSNLLLSSGGQW